MCNISMLFGISGARFIECIVYWVYCIILTGFKVFRVRLLTKFGKGELILKASFTVYYVYCTFL